LVQTADSRSNTTTGTANAGFAGDLVTLERKEQENFPTGGIGHQDLSPSSEMMCGLGFWQVPNT